MSEQKTWVVSTHANVTHVVTGTRVELDFNQARTTFYNGAEPVASFVGLNSFALQDSLVANQPEEPTPEEPTPEEPTPEEPTP